MAREAGLEGRHVLDARVSGPLRVAVVAERALVLERDVVELPERVVAAEREDALGRLGRGLRVLVERQRVVLHTMRTLSGPYVVRTWSIVGSTREQYGHWKSLYWTMVTGASRLPHIGFLLEMGTGDSLSSHVALADSVSAAISPPFSRCWS